MATIKINELATSSIVSSDFLVKADGAGIATKNTIENLLAPVAKLNGDASELFKVANAVSSDEAITKGTFDTAINALEGALILQDNWNADTNTPDISGTTQTGYYWIVSVDGATDLGGITDWKVNDWAIKTDSGWAKVDNTDKVISVAGKIGEVVLGISDITSLQSDLDDKANENEVVKTTGNQTIAGFKNFTSDVKLSDGARLINMLIPNGSVGGFRFENENADNHWSITTATGQAGEQGDFYITNQIDGSSVSLLIKSNNDAKFLEDLEAKTFTGDGSGLTNIPSDSTKQNLTGGNTITGRQTHNNTGVERGIFVINPEGGTGVWVDNEGNGDGVELANSGTGVGLDLSNTSTGKGIKLGNSAAGTGIDLANNSTGTGIDIDNLDTGDGIDLDNSGLGKGIDLGNTGGGIGINLGNSAAGTGIDLTNSSTGRGVNLTNTDAGIGIDLGNSGTGQGVKATNSLTGQAIQILNTGSGIGSYTINSDAGTGINVANNSTGTGIALGNSGAGKGINLGNSSTGTGIHLVNSSTGQGTYIANNSTGDAIDLYNSSTGRALKVLNQGEGKGIEVTNNSTGDAIISTTTAVGTGFNYVGKNVATNTFTVDKEGNIVGNDAAFGGNVGISGNNVIVPSLGSDQGALQVLDSEGKYGLQFWIENSGNSSIQSARVDGTATSYDLNLQPLGGNSTFGGNVGIGTDTPETVAHISTTSETAYSNLGYTAGSALTVKNQSNTVNTFSAIDIKSGANFASGVRLAAINTGGATSTVGYFSLGVRDASNNFIERLKIDSTGDTTFGGSVSTGALFSLSDGFSAKRVANFENSKLENSFDSGAFISIGKESISRTLDIGIYGNGSNEFDAKIITKETGGSLILGVKDHETLEINSSGDATFEGNVNLEALKNTSIISLKSTTNDSSWSVGDRIGGIDFYSGDGSGAGSGKKASISYEVEAGNTGSTLAMVFRGAGVVSGENNLERLRIDSSGDATFGGDVSLVDDNKLIFASQLTKSSYIKGIWADNNRSGLSFHTFVVGVDTETLKLNPTGGSAFEGNVKMTSPNSTTDNLTLQGAGSNYGIRAIGSQSFDYFRVSEFTGTDRGKLEILESGVIGITLTGDGDATFGGDVQADSYKSSDGSSGDTGTFQDRAGAVITVKNGLITNIG